MPSLISRGAVLTASRASNFAILTLSPLLLVRILNVDAYGRYQEFMIYAALFTTIGSFGIDASLTYFLPRYPGRESEYVSQNSILVLLVSSTLIAIFLLLRRPFLAIASYDFTLPLAAYVFFFVNMNWLEYYWIAMRRTDLVLYYSAARLAIRASVLLAVAYLTHDVRTILWSLVIVECARSCLVAAFAARAGLLRLTPHLPRLREQLQFAGPVGLSAIMQQTSLNIGKLFIGGMIGPAALAYYSVAGYLLPMVRVVRNSIADVIFPEMVRRSDSGRGALRLWQRSNVVFCALFFPPFVLLMWYSDLFVTTLFTDKYGAAVPIFQIYAFWILRRCFTIDVLLRTRGKTGFMLKGTGVAVVLNLALMVVLYRWLGLVGPAIAFIAAEVVLEIYYARVAMKEFGLSVSTLVDWASVGRVVAGCFAGIPFLIGARFVPGPALGRATAAALVFLGVSWLVAHRLGVSDIGRIAGFALSLMRRRTLSRAFRPPRR